MLIRPAEESFQKGLQALANGKRMEALALFEAALELEKRHGARQPQARYLSFYGLCLGFETDRTNDGIRFCRDAISLEFFNPDLCWNLGRVLLQAGRRRDAYEAFQKGLSLQDGHAGILRELEKMGVRRTPAVPFLARHNPINVILGRLTRPNGTSRTNGRG